MTTLASRIAKALSHARMTPATLAREVGVSQVAVFKWCTGRTKSLRSETCERVAGVLQVNEQWLATGKGHMSRHALDLSTSQLLKWRRRLEQALRAVDALIAMQGRS